MYVEVRMNNGEKPPQDITLSLQIFFADKTYQTTTLQLLKEKFPQKSKKDNLIQEYHAWTLA